VARAWCAAELFGTVVVIVGDGRAEGTEAKMTEAA
jgi:hypothetical protein